MAKHRGSVFTVVREEWNIRANNFLFSAVIGVYHGLNRAEEIAAKCQQEMVDHGVGELFRFQVQVSTYYDE